MDILIKDLEMPKPGMVFNIYADGRVTNHFDEFGKTIGKAVPVPPHGDLIDRDAARGSIKPWSPEDERNGCTFDTVKKLMHTMLDRAPTIIPASEEE